MARPKKNAPDASQGPCRHPHLAFAAGGLYLRCCTCPRRFGALLPDSDVLDVMARGELLEGEHRSNPLAGVHSHSM